MVKIEMSRNEIYKFYENKIDDIKDEDTADKLFHLLGQLDDLLIELEGGIDEALEQQKMQEDSPEYYPYFDRQTLINEFNNENRRC